MSDATEAVQWLSATGTLNQIAREVLAPAIAAALNENARAAGYAEGVKAEREAAAKAVIENRSCKVMHSFQPSQCEACYWFDNIAAAIRARSDAQEVKP